MSNSQTLMDAMRWFSCWLQARTSPCSIVSRLFGEHIIKRQIPSISLTITLNVPLIWKVREIIFFLAGKTHNGTVRGIFRGSRDLLDP
jgi:hypothetical protein